VPILGGNMTTTTVARPRAKSAAARQRLAGISID
jgi:hypothetical protein